MTDLRALAEKALKANPEPWHSVRSVRLGVFLEADAAFIAAASPSVVLALLDVAEAARELMQYEEDGAPDYIGWDPLFDALRAALARASEVMGE